MNKYKKNKDSTLIKAQLVEFWVDAKKLGKSVVKNVDKEIPKVKEGIGDFFNSFETKDNKKKEKKGKTRKGKSFWKVTLLTVFNLLVMVWIWFALLMTLIGLYIGGIGILVSGFATILSSLFVLVNPVDFMLKNIGFSGLFAGIGLFLMGILWLIGTSNLMKVLSYLTKQYIRLNKRISKR